MGEWVDREGTHVCQPHPQAGRWAGGWIERSTHEPRPQVDRWVGGWVALWLSSQMSSLLSLSVVKMTYLLNFLSSISESVSLA